jgi:fido (protein-threonine AMPylation protein)
VTQPFARSPHLVTLIAEVERLATRLTAADPEVRQPLREEQVLAAARASLALDGAQVAATLDPSVATARVEQAGAASGSDAAADTGAASDAGSGRGTSPGTEVAQSRRTRATWLDTFGVLDDPEEDLVAALELLGVLAADDSDDLTDAVLPEAATVLPELHRRLTRGLVAPERAGAMRQLEQAVHDGATGRIVFRTAPPVELPRELSLLGAWLASTGTREHGLIASGILHLELLRLHPFDAANGRLARAAARLVLRTRELDPDHLAVPEVALGRDLLGYHEEVARTLRRRDATIWLERWAEAVASGLRRSARVAGLLATDAAPAATRFVAATSTFTITELRAALEVGPEAARAHVDALLDAGLIDRVPASRGLRFETSGAITA